MTSCSKPIWEVTFSHENDQRQIKNHIAANNLKELLSFIASDAVNKIIKIEKTDKEVTYHY